MIRDKLGTICGWDRFAFPAPVVQRISLTDLAGNAHPIRWPGLLDTGAERSAVPLEVCKELRLAPRDWRSPRGFDREATPRRTPLYYLCLLPNGLPRATLLVYGVPRTNVLLGRDFLANLIMIVDGPRGRLRIGRSTILSRILIPCIGLR